MYKIVLLRHGESEWNKKGLFTGWVDVKLTPRGEAESRQAGRELKKRGFIFDLAFTSPLRRAAKTLDLALETMGQRRVPIKVDWRLNERHYGALQGLNKKETAAKFGEEQTFLWRRGYDVRPPKISSKSRYNQAGSPKYGGIKVPLTESLQDVVTRVIPFWEQSVGPEIKAGKNIFISASGNSLRALIKYLDKISDEDIAQLNIPTGIPLIYELDNQLRPIKHYYLADKKRLEKEIEKVRDQAKAK